MGTTFFLGLITSMMTLLPIGTTAAQDANRITILYDAFGPPSDLKKDWGYSALIAYNGKRILFDTGNNAEFFRHNVEALKLDLSKRDLVVLSHRHGDHTSGLSYVLSKNPNVPVHTRRKSPVSARPSFPASSPPSTRTSPACPPDALF